MDIRTLNSFKDEMSKIGSSGLRVIVHPGAEDWAPSEEDIQSISRQILRDGIVELYPRSSVAEVWESQHPGQTYDKDEYAFRAYTSKNRAVVFVDKSESKESALWVILHELAHMELYGSPYLFRAYRSIPMPDDYSTNDEAHEADPEEQMANLVATQWMGRLGYGEREFRRPWWRRRVALLRSLVKESAAIPKIGLPKPRLKVKGLKQPRLATPRLGAHRLPGGTPKNPFVGNRMDALTRGQIVTKLGGLSVGNIGLGAGALYAGSKLIKKTIKGGKAGYAKGASPQVVAPPQYI